MKRLTLILLTFCMWMAIPNKGFGNESPLNLAPPEFVQADGEDIQVPGYSVPSFVDWNNDLLCDLVIGEGGDSGDAKVRVYINVGTESNPQFSDYVYAQSEGSDLTLSAYTSMGCYPRMVNWNRDTDDLKDLLIGLPEGQVMIFLNIGTHSEPMFDAGELIEAGQDNETVYVGGLATPTLVDWNDNHRQDLVVGSINGSMRIFSNCSCSPEGIPSFNFTEPSGDPVEEDHWTLKVPSGRSSPVILDLDHDGKKDILTGNTDGQLLFYKNVGTIGHPNFSGYSFVESGGVPIDLPGQPRSRPFVCYWTGNGHFGPIDGYPDVLIGSDDGKIRLYRSIPTPGDIDQDGDVDFEDLALLADNWQQNNPRPGGQSNQ